MNNEQKLKNALEALEELVDRNGLKNDFDAYCYDLVKWGMGKSWDENSGKWIDSDSPVKPNPKDFGL